MGGFYDLSSLQAMSEESAEAAEDAPVEESIEQAQDRYLAAMHAMQSGVATKQELDPSETEPKHLRVGVNSAMMQQGALVRLLIAKGVFTEAEWWSAIADGAEHEVKLYEEWLSDKFGSNITLG